MEQPTSVILISPNARGQLRQDNNTKGFSQLSCYFLDLSRKRRRMFLNNIIQKRLQVFGRIIIAVDTSALAAKLIKSDAIAHSTFVILVPCGADVTYNISLYFTKAQKLQDTSMVIWDVITMCYHLLLVALDRTLEDVMHRTHPLSRNLITFSGYFFQIFPVILSGSRAQASSKSLNSSFPYDKFQSVWLTENMTVWTYFKTTPLHRKKRHSFLKSLSTSER